MRTMTRTRTSLSQSLSLRDDLGCCPCQLQILSVSCQSVCLFVYLSVCLSVQSCQFVSQCVCGLIPRQSVHALHDLEGAEN